MIERPLNAELRRLPGNIAPAAGEQFATPGADGGGEPDKQAGAPKAWKSVLNLDAAAAVCDGGQFLERFPAKQGEVLYWLADDPDENRFVFDFQTLHLRHPENFVLWAERRALDADGLPELERLLVEHKPR